jgi:hypothetical protein
VAEGPRIPRPESLVSAIAAGIGTVGLVVRTDDGDEEASYLRFFGPDDEPTPAADGDLVAWSFGGREAVAISTTGTSSACGTLHTRTFELPTQTAFESDTPSCGTPIAFARSTADSYVTLRRGDHAITMRPSPLIQFFQLRDWILVGASRDGALLVVPDVNLPELAGQPLSLYATGVSEPNSPTPLGIADRALTFELFLSWSARGEDAYVLGRYSGQRGVWRVATSRLDDLAPSLVARIEDQVPVHLTVTNVEVPILTIGDRFFRAGADGRLSELPLPGDAPPPDGPILWTSSLGRAAP